MVLKPVKAARFWNWYVSGWRTGGFGARSHTVELIATLLERERESICRTWLARMTETGGLTAIQLTEQELCEYLPDALSEIVYRLRYPQPLGPMTLFSMA